MAKSLEDVASEFEQARERFEQADEEQSLLFIALRDDPHQQGKWTKEKTAWLGAWNEARARWAEYSAAADRLIHAGISELSRGH